jgi:hypothetical protein
MCEYVAEFKSTSMAVSNTDGNDKKKVPLSLRSRAISDGEENYLNILI